MAALLGTLAQVPADRRYLQEEFLVFVDRYQGFTGKRSPKLDHLVPRRVPVMLSGKRELSCSLGFLLALWDRQSSEGG